MISVGGSEVSHMDEESEVNDFCKESEAEANTVNTGEQEGGA